MPRYVPLHKHVEAFADHHARKIVGMSMHRHVVDAEISEIGGKKTSGKVHRGLLVSDQGPKGEGPVTTGLAIKETANSQYTFHPIENWKLDGKVPTQVRTIDKKGNERFWKLK